MALRAIGEGSRAGKTDKLNYKLDPTTAMADPVENYEN